MVEWLCVVCTNAVNHSNWNLNCLSPHAFPFDNMSGIQNAGRYQNSIPMKCLYVHKCIALFRNGKKNYDIQLRDPDEDGDHRVHRLAVENTEDDRTLPHDLKTMLTLRRHDQMNMEIDISEFISGFSPFFLIYMNDISVIDISGCKSIPVVDFVDSIVACSNLKVLNMSRCTQFSELHMLQMLPKLEKLNYLNVKYCEEISFPIAHWIISCLEKLTVVDFKPKHPVDEVKEWIKLHTIFFNVKFGLSFTGKIPFGAQYGWLPEHLEEDGDEQ